MQHICDMFGVRQTDDRTTPKSTRWNIYRAALYYAWGPADVASDTRRVCTHQLCGASGSAHFSYSFERRRRSKLSVERTDPFSCILVLLSLSDPASVYPVYLFA